MTTSELILNKIGRDHKNPLTFILRSIKVVSELAIRHLLTRFFLRNATQVQGLVSVKGWPKIVNKGKLVIGQHVRIWSNIQQAKILVGNNGELIIGENSRVNGAHISCSLQISIGKNVRISPYVLILDSDFHDIDDHFSSGKNEPVIIEDDVWIASKATILKGVRIGHGSVIAAGAVVVRNVEPNTVVGGVPARFIKSTRG